MHTPLFKILEKVPDPRYKRGVRHSIPSILRLVTLGFACRLVAVEHIVNFFSPIWHKIGPEIGSNRPLPPDPTTVRRALEEIDREAFQAAFIEWISQVVKDKDLTVSVDGKVLKGSACEKILNVFAHDIKLSLDPLEIPEGQGEATVLKEHLNRLFSDYPGISILVGDAAYSGRNLCQAIKDAGRDYVMGLKGNQGKLHAGIKALFEDANFDRAPDAKVVKKTRKKAVRK